MAFSVTINDQTFSLHDRYKNIIASVAKGEYLSIYDDHARATITVTKFTSILDDDYTVKEYLFEGTDRQADADALAKRGQENGMDLARLWGLDPNPHVVSDDLAFYFAHLPVHSRIKLKNMEYVLYERNTSIIISDMPLESGLWSQIRFDKV